MNARPRRLTAAAAALSCLVPLLATFGPPQFAYADQPVAPASKVKTVVSDPPPPPDPPSDIVGRPAASTVVRTDGLMIDEALSVNTTNHWWAGVKTDLSGLDPVGHAGMAAARRIVNQNSVVNRSARLLDPQAERVLSLQHSAAGGGGLWQVAETNYAVDNWHGNDDIGTKVTATAGGTFTFTLASGQALATLGGSSDLSQQLSVAKGDRTSELQQWSLVAAADNPGFYQLVNRADGTCLNVLGGSTEEGAAVGSWTCTQTSSPDDNELWRAAAGSDGTALLMSKATGFALSADPDTGKVTQRAYRAGDRTDQQVWRLAEIKEPSGTIASWSVPASNDPAMPASLATGDLDRAVGSNGQYGDEAVVAYAANDHRLAVRVIDYNANASHLLTTAPDAELPLVGATVAGTWFPGSVGVAIGDFDGDLLNEVAVTWQNDKGFHATIFRYTDSGQDRKLAVVRPDLLLYQGTGVQPSLLSGLADTVSGDFDGNHTEDLAITFAAPPKAGQPVAAWVGVTTFTADDKLGAEHAAQISTSSTAHNGRTGLLLPPDGQTYVTRGPRLAAGLFQLNDNSGQTMQRRQLAMTWTDRQSDSTGTDVVGTTIALLQVLTDTDPGTLTFSHKDKTLGVDGNPVRALQVPLSMAAGGFGGRGSGTTIPVWGVAVAGRLGDVNQLTTNVTPAVQLVSFASDGTPNRTANIEQAPGEVALRVTAYDRLGTSIMLGAPIVMSVDQMVKASLIAAQPPAHSDWLDGEFINVSRKPDFNVQLGSGKDTTLTHADTTKTSSAIGVAEGVDAKGTVKTGIDWAASVAATAEVSAKFKQEWGREQLDTTKYTTSWHSEATSTASDDDIINGYTVNNTVYRYPILGGPITTTDGQPATSDTCKANCYAYYEVTIPGAVHVENGSGRNDAWYQPSWQNGNALSYPRVGTNGAVATPDLGSYSYKDENNDTVTKTETLFNANNDLGGNHAEYKLDFAQGTAKDTKRTTNHTFTEGGEVKAGLKVKWGGPAKGTAEGTVSVGVDHKSTWSHTVTGTNDTTTSSSFALNVPAIQADQSYSVSTAYYNDTAGVQKVVHAVDLTKSAQGKSWWLANYGGHPDPALNLPMSTVMTQNDVENYVVPKWSGQSNRQLIRGFWALQPTDSSSPATSAAPYAENPRAGDPVTFAVQVHNYSLIAAKQPVPVDFYAVPVSANGMTVLNAPRLFIGQGHTPTLDAQGMATVYSPQWQAVGPQDGTGLQNWRIFVVLNDGHSDATSEIHPLNGTPCPEASVTDGKALKDPMTDTTEKLACGQNNQGYGEIQVMGTGLENGKAHGALSLNGSSLVVDGQGLTAPKPGGTSQVVVGQPVTGLVHASSTGPNSDISHVYVYDGSPDKGLLLAHAKLSGADATNGGYARFNWQPTKAGRHVLYQVLETSDGQRQVQKVLVQVVAHGTAAAVRLSPTTKTTPSGRPVRYRVVAYDLWGNRVGNATRKSRLTISPDGSCRRGVCRARRPGVHTVTATFNQLSDQARLIVTAPRHWRRVASRSVDPPTGKPPATVPKHG